MPHVDLADPVDQTTLRPVGRRARFGMKDPRKNILGAFQNEQTMKWQTDKHWRKFGLDHAPENLGDMNRLSAGARTIRVHERDPATGREGTKLTGTHKISIGGLEVPVVDGEIVLLDSELGNEILQKSKQEGKALDNFINTNLEGGDQYIYFTHPAMYAEMKEKHVLPSDLASLKPSDRDTADRVWMFSRYCRKYLGTVLWSGAEPSVGHTKHDKHDKLAKQVSHAAVETVTNSL